MKHVVTMDGIALTLDITLAHRGSVINSDPPQSVWAVIVNGVGVGHWCGEMPAATCEHARDGSAPVQSLKSHPHEEETILRKIVRFLDTPDARRRDWMTHREIAWAIRGVHSGDVYRALRDGEKLHGSPLEGRMIEGKKRWRLRPSGRTSATRYHTRSDEGGVSGGPILGMDDD